MPLRAADSRGGDGTEHFRRSGRVAVEVHHCVFPLTLLLLRLLVRLSDQVPQRWVRGPDGLFWSHQRWVVYFLDLLATELQCFDPCAAVEDKGCDLLGPDDHSL